MTSRVSFSCRLLLISLALGVASRPVYAQSRIYVSGDLFAEVTRMSRTTVTPEALLVNSSPPADGVTAGGGGRVGAFLSPEWSLELGVDSGATISHTRTQSVALPVLVGVSVAAPQFQSHTSTRFGAASVLIGYHPLARGRIHAGFRGGVSLMRTERTSTSASVSSITYPPFSPLPGPSLVPVISVVTTEVTTILNGLTATLAAEAAIDMSRHFAVVPEMRVHAGGLGGFVLRPGVAARWMW
jgi:hypothetical protein